MKSKFWVLCGVALLCLGSVRCKIHIQDNDEEIYLDRTESREDGRTGTDEDFETELYNARNTWNELTNEISELSRMQKSPEDNNDKRISSFKDDAVLKDEEEKEDDDGEGEEEEKVEDECPGFKNCVETGGSCKKEGDATCECPPDSEYATDIGCKVLTNKCYEAMQMCDLSGGYCLFDKNKKMTCICPPKSEFKRNACVALEGECPKLVENCEETGGHCLATHEDGIFECVCPKNTTFGKKGCTVPQYKCRQLQALCVETGGSCELDLSGEKPVIKCKCPTDTEYKKEGCRALEGKCPDPNCEETGGLCLSDKNKEISCLCPDYTEYEEDGCKVLEDTCRKATPNCEETGGSCGIDISEKDVKCKCPTHTEYKQEGCTALAGKCPHPNCEETGGSCLSGRDNVIQCICPKDTEYKEDGCKVMKDKCPQIKPNCEETGGICEVLKSKTIQCTCPKDTEFKQEGCTALEGKCPKVKCEETGGMCISDKSKDLQCICPEDTEYKEDGCKVMKDKCPQFKPNCEETGGICEVAKNKTVQCICPKDTHYKPEGCKVLEGKCPEARPNCEETGGTCISAQNKTIQCLCPTNTEYKEDGCKVLKDKCPQLKPKCEDTGGSCVLAKDKTIQCLCPKDTDYKDNVGCKDKCHDFGCKNEGECEIKDGNPTCICKDPYTGDKCEKNKCEGFKCKNGGTCEVKDGKPTCKCTEDFTGDTCEKLQDDACRTKFKDCLETEGTCESGDGENFYCKCPKDQVYENEGGCKDLCKEVCGENTDVKCSGDKMNKEKIKCSCTESNEDFDYSLKECRVDQCKEKCGTIKCEGNKFEADEVKCICPNQNQDFIESEKKCQINYCRQVCGTDSRLVCKEEYKAKTSKDCSCNDDDYVFISKRCQKKCSNDDECIYGSCIEKEKGAYKLCKCSEDVSGDTCEVIADCVGEKFKNCKGDNGKCTYLDGKAQCVCPDGKDLYTKGGYCAVKCEKDEQCEGSNRKCTNNFCLCEAGLEGDDCQEVTGCAELKDVCEKIDTKCIFNKATPGKPICECKNGYIYDTEEKTCKNPFCYPNNPCKSSECTYDDSIGSGYCKCSEEKFFDYKTGECKAFPNKCLLKKTPCGENEECRDGQCKCKYTVKKGDECKPKLCSPNPCFDNAKCSEEDGSCSCEEGKYYVNNKCVDAKCRLNDFKKNCTCPSGMKRKENSEDCEPTTGELCSTECGYGLCVKKDKKESCKCFNFATPSSDKCILKRAYCPDVLQKDSMKCECTGQYTQANDGITCRLKTCKDEDAIKDCAAKGGECKMNWKTTGYYCACREGYETDENKICKDPCSIEKNIKECESDNKICFNSFSTENAVTYDCGCPPTVKKDNGKCSGKSENAYLFKNIPVLKKRYQLDSGIDKVLLNADLIQSMKLTFGDLEYGYLYDYKIAGDIVDCSVWINFKTAPKKVELDKIKLASKSFSKVCEDCDESAVVWPPNLLLSEKGLKEAEPAKLEFCSKEVKDLLCGPGATCKENKCTCEGGFKITEFSTRDLGGVYKIQRCDDINECAMGIDSCSSNTTCVNTYGSYKCVCKEGYKKEKVPEDPENDKSNCYDMCTPSPCKKGKCIPKDNTFDCQCDPGSGGSLCDHADANYASAKKGTVVVGAVLGTILAIGAIAVLYYIIKIKKKSGSEDFHPAPRMDHAEMAERRAMRGVSNKAYE